MAARANPAYFQHSSGGAPAGHMTVHVNPAYFQPGASHGSSAVHGRKGHHGRSKHGRAGVHGRPHDTMRTHVADPWKHRGMGRNKR